MSADADASLPVAARWVTRGSLQAWPLPAPEPEGDKESRGRLLIVAGSAELPGAALLAARAALRAGAGKLALGVPASVAPGLALAVPEARVIALPQTPAGGPADAGIELLRPLLGRVDAVLIGPGLADEAQTPRFVQALLRDAGEAAVVLDALAMDVLRLQARFDRPPLLTPHAGEMAHLRGIDKAAVQADQQAACLEAARRWNAHVALKGACTWIAAPAGAVWRHASRQPGLAVSGSGDVLAGIVAGLAARGAALDQAMAWGAWLHANAAAALARRHGELGYLPSELADEVPRLLRGSTRAAP